MRTMLKSFNNKPRINGVFSRDDIPKINDRAYVINLDDKKVKEHSGFLNLLRETQLCILILLGLHIFHKKY